MLEKAKGMIYCPARGDHAVRDMIRAQPGACWCRYRGMSLKQMAIRHAGVCRECGVELPAKTTAVYDFTAKNVICLGCRGDTGVVHHPVAARAPRPVGPAVAGTTDRRRADRRSTDRRGAGNPN